MSEIQGNGNVYQRLQKARVMLHSGGIKGTGRNEYADYGYIEMSDFLPKTQMICAEVGLCGVVSFGELIALLRIVNVDQTDDFIDFTSPMSTANLKGCHPVQNLGAVEAYLRRYLWFAALEVVEHDELDTNTGKTADTEKPVFLSQVQLDEMKKEIEDRDVNEKKFLAVAAAKSLEEIETVRFDGLMIQIRTKPVVKEAKKAPPKTEKPADKPKDETPAQTFECPQVPGLMLSGAMCCEAPCHENCPVYQLYLNSQAKK